MRTNSVDIINLIPIRSGVLQLRNLARSNLEITDAFKPEIIRGIDKIGNVVTPLINHIYLVEKMKLNWFNLYSYDRLTRFMICQGNLWKPSADQRCE